MPERIQMSRQRPWRSDNPDAVIVARPSKWGNPYRVGDNSGFYGIPHDRETVVIFFKFDMEYGDGLWWEAGNRYLTVADVRAELAGRDLACWCPLPAPGDPDVCHAAVLLELAAEHATGAPVRVIDPDCRDGKHRACVGTAWSENEGRVIDCECRCHEEEDHG